MYACFNGEPGVETMEVTVVMNPFVRMSLDHSVRTMRPNTWPSSIRW